MARHILSSLSIKKQWNLKFIRWADSQWHYNNNQKHLCNMALFIFNDRLQFTMERFTGGTQYFLRDQGPFSLQLQLQIIQQIMRSSANLTLQNWPHRKAKRVQIRAPWGPFIFSNERWHVGLNPASSDFGSMWQRGVLLKSPRRTIKLFMCPGK